jgi:hypothetical protein
MPRPKSSEIKKSERLILEWLKVHYPQSYRNVIGLAWTLSGEKK